jgi:hypothetical protein
LDGKPVLPAAAAMELMAEAASQACPEFEVVRVKDFRVLGGIVVQDGDMPIRLVSKTNVNLLNSKQMSVNILTDNNPKKVHYSSVVEFAGSAHTQTIPGWEELKADHHFPMTIQEAYKQWLFHGPILQGIHSIRGVDNKGIRAWLTPSTPGSYLSENSKGSWLIDPVIIDCAFQLVILWSRMHLDMTSLPSYYKAYTKLAPLTGEKIDCQINVLPGSGSNIIHSDIAFFDAEGNLLGVMEGVESTCSKSLNRLTGDKGRLFVNARTV